MYDTAAGGRSSANQRGTLHELGGAALGIGLRATLAAQ